MKLQNAFSNGLFGLVATKVIRGWLSTLDLRIGFYDPSVDLVKGLGSTRIYLVWHENFLFPLYLGGNCHVSLLTSRHRDADVLQQIANFCNMEVVRGSTSRGGATALRKLMDSCRTNHLAATPDGPRGPRRSMSAGFIYLASKLGIPIVLLGVGYDRPWRVGSWDRFAVPRPFTRGRCIASPEIVIPPNLDRDGIEHYRQRLGSLMNQLCDEAERWAESGHRIEGEVVGWPRPGSPPAVRDFDKQRRIAGRVQNKVA